MGATDEQLAGLYRQAVLAHSREPRNYRRLEPADHRATGHNPLCGDEITIYLREARGVVAEAAFEGSGCAIALASASMLTELVPGRTPAEVHGLVEAVTGAFHDASAALPGELAALGGVRAYPARIRCATLPWRTLDAALADAAQPVSTERESNHVRQ